MKRVNVLFATGTILTALYLDYDAITDFYSYLTPLNKIVMNKGVFSDNPCTFQKTMPFGVHSLNLQECVNFTIEKWGKK